jgi:glucose/mannose transport system permease protein
MIFRKSYGFIYLTPVLILTGVLYLLILWNLVASLTVWNGILPTWKWAGFSNYAELFTLGRFWDNLQHNLIWLVVFIVPTSFLGFVLAEFFTSMSRSEVFFRQIFLYPMALSYIVSGTLWAWMYDPGSGLINSILKAFGFNVSHLGWIADPKIAIYCMIVAGFWQYTGFALVIYLGAIRGLPTEMYEAAHLDGASRARVMFNITLPNVGHGTLITTTMLAIFTVKVFDLVYVMTGGGPGDHTEVLPFLMYQISYSQRDFGLGTAISTVILILAAIMVIPYSNWAIKKWVQE